MSVLQTINERFRKAVKGVSENVAEELKQVGQKLKEFTTLYQRTSFYLSLDTDLVDVTDPNEYVNLVSAMVTSNAIPYIGAKNIAKAMEVNIQWAHIVKSARWMARRYDPNVVSNPVQDLTAVADKLKQDMTSGKLNLLTPENQTRFIDAINILEQVKVSPIFSYIAINREVQRQNLIGYLDIALRPYASMIFGASFDKDVGKPTILITPSGTAQAGGGYGQGGIQSVYKSDYTGLGQHTLGGMQQPPTQPPQEEQPSKRRGKKQAGSEEGGGEQE